MNGVDISQRAADVFLQAATYIRAHGWRRDGMGTDGAPRCSMGALASVYPTDADEKLSSLMYESLYGELNGISLTKFNHVFNDGTKVAELYEAVAGKLSQDQQSTAA